MAEDEKLGLFFERSEAASASLSHIRDGLEQIAKSATTAHLREEFQEAQQQQPVPIQTAPAPSAPQNSQDD